VAREGLVISDFSGGLNNVVDPSLIEETEVAGLVNLIISRTGKLISRPPIVKVADYPVGATDAKALGYFRNEDSTVFMVVATDSKTYIYDLVADIWTEVWGYKALDMTAYANRLYLVSDTNGGGYWSKVASTYQWTALNDPVTGIPNANQIHFTKGRIYVSSRALGNTSTLRYSELDSTNLGTTIDEFPVTNFIKVNEGDGDSLIKIIEGNSELFLFRSNSTYRLAFSASADPSLGSLTSMSQTIGADCSRSVIEGDNYLAVLHAGTLYQFAGYNYFPFNPANKVQFKVQPNFTGQKQGLTKLGPYLLVWHHGYMYCHDTETGLWSEWESDTNAAHFLEAPRGSFLASSAVPTAYGVPHSDFASKGLLKLALENTATSAETIRCSMTTRTYDLGQPSLFKRLFGWELLGVFVNWVEGGLTPIDAYTDLNEQITWGELSAYTWQEAEDGEIPWLPVNSIVPVIVPRLPRYNPRPVVVRISGKQTFKRGYFTIRFQNDGTTITAPSRLDGIVLYLTNGRRMAIGRTA
jgi:hypothetical protein